MLLNLRLLYHVNYLLLPGVLGEEPRMVEGKLHLLPPLFSVVSLLVLTEMWALHLIFWEQQKECNEKEMVKENNSTLSTK